MSLRWAIACRLARQVGSASRQRQDSSEPVPQPLPGSAERVRGHSLNTRVVVLRVFHEKPLRDSESRTSESVIRQSHPRDSQQESSSQDSSTRPTRRSCLRVLPAWGWESQPRVSGSWASDLEALWRGPARGRGRGPEPRAPPAAGGCTASYQFWYLSKNLGERCAQHTCMNWRPRFVCLRWQCTTGESTHQTFQRASRNCQIE